MAVVDQLKAGQTTTVAALFDLVDREASNSHLVAREKFGLVVGCVRSEIFMHVRADSAPRWRDFAVWVLQSQPKGSAAWVPSSETWDKEHVRASLTAIPTCDEVNVIVGGESIVVTLDDHWIIRDVTHRPIASSSDTFESALRTLRKPNGLRPLADASPSVRPRP
jgi:hypothetical protein